MRDRKAFFQMIAKAHSSQDVALIVPSVGWISTQYGEFNDIVKMLKENGISVVSLNPAESIILYRGKASLYRKSHGRQQWGSEAERTK